MIITTYDNSVGIDFSKISICGEYHSHKIYRNWLGRPTLKINFLEGRLTSTVLTSYKFRFDTWEDAKHVIDTYIKTLK